MAKLSAEIVQLVENVIVRSPYGALLGTTLIAAEENRVEVALPYREEITTIGDTVHGGAISGLIDIAATASFWASSKIEGGSRGTTIGFTVNFLAAGRGQDLVATATVRRRGRGISTGEVSVRDGDGKEIAVALITYKLSA